MAASIRMRRLPGALAFLSLALSFGLHGDAAPRAASGDWLTRARRDLAAREYEASRNDEGLQAPNRAHDLRTYFSGSGARVVSRTVARSPMSRSGIASASA